MELHIILFTAIKGIRGSRAADQLSVDTHSTLTLTHTQTHTDVSPPPSLCSVCLFKGSVHKNYYKTTVSILQWCFTAKLQKETKSDIEVGTLVQIKSEYFENIVGILTE